MEDIAALLLVIGCSKDLSQCQELPAPVPIFETEEECAALLQPTIASFTGKRPAVLGQCVYVDPAMPEEDAQLVWNVEADGKLIARIVSAGTLVAANANREQSATRSE